MEEINEGASGVATDVVFIYPRSGEAADPGTEYYEQLLGRTIGSFPDFRVRVVSAETPAEARRALKGAPGGIAILSGAGGASQLPLALWLRMKGRKLLIVHHHFNFREHRAPFRSLWRVAELLFLRTAHRIVVPGPYMHAELLESFEPEKLFFWKIPIEKGAVEEVDPEWGRLAYVGAVEPRKGLIYLLEALAQLKGEGIECHLDIMGPHRDAAYLARLRTFAEQHSLDVTFHGYVSAERKDELLRRAWLFAFPSLLEGFGIPLAEAQRYGLPTVCFDNSAMPYTVKHGVNGLICPDRDSAAFARAISRLLSDSDLRSRLSAGAAAGARTRFNSDDFRRTVAHSLRRFLS